jgi:predicted lipid-binding transport protein (Tim44 family)
VLTRWLPIRRWLQGAGVLALLVGAGGAAGARPAPVGQGRVPQAALAVPAPARDAAPAPSRQQTPAPTARRWLAPLGGLAAGLGLVALAGHLGFGPNVAPVLLLLMLAVLFSALALVLASRRARSSSSSVPAARYTDLWQGIGGPSYAPRPPTVRIDTRGAGSSATRSGAPAVARGPFGVPPEFDTPGFLESAKQSFERLQGAWDRADLIELGECATDEMFNALTHELRVRVGPSRTEVVELAASLLGIETAAGEHRASVRFSGALKVNGEDERLDEVWNLSKPIDGSSGWLLSGIQQLN